MLITWFAAIARREQLILIAMLIPTGILGAALRISNGTLRSGLFTGTIVVVLALFSASLLAHSRYHPAILHIRPRIPSFATPPDPSRVLFVAAVTVLAVIQVSEGADAAFGGERRFAGSATSLGFLIFVAVMHWHVLRRRPGVHILPGGVLDQQPFGSLFVPWGAFARDLPASPTRRDQVALYFQRTDLIRKRGLRLGRNTLSTTTDASFLARVIDEYVAHPERRPGIGTDQELRRLTAQPFTTTVSNSP